MRLVVAADSEPRQLNPAIVASNGVFFVASQVVEPLAEASYDEDGLRPLLATGWEGAADGLSITFSLRDGVSWHDGGPFTSADVAFSAMDVWKPLPNIGRGVFANLEAVETPDARTAVFRFSKPKPTPTQLSWLGERLVAYTDHAFDLAVAPTVFRGARSTARLAMTTMPVRDAFQIVPGFLLALALAFVSDLGPSLVVVAIAIALGAWTGPARLARSRVLALREADFVAAARVLGMHPAEIAFRQVMPLALPAVLAVTSVIVAGAILTEAALITAIRCETARTTARSWPTKR